MIVNWALAEDKIKELRAEVARLEAAIAIYCREEVEGDFETDRECVDWFLATINEP